MSRAPYTTHRTTRVSRRDPTLGWQQLPQLRGARPRRPGTGLAWKITAGLSLYFNAVLAIVFLLK